MNGKMYSWTIIAFATTLLILRCDAFFFRSAPCGGSEKNYKKLHVAVEKCLGEPEKMSADERCNLIPALHKCIKQVHSSQEGNETQKCRMDQLINEYTRGMFHTLVVQLPSGNKQCREDIKSIVADIPVLAYDKHCKSMYKKYQNCDKKFGSIYRLNVYTKTRTELCDMVKKLNMKEVRECYGYIPIESDCNPIMTVSPPKIRQVAMEYCSKKCDRYMNEFTRENLRSECLMEMKPKEFKALRNIHRGREPESLYLQCKDLNEFIDRADACIPQYTKSCRFYMFVTSYITGHSAIAPPYSPKNFTVDGINGMFVYARNTCPEYFQKFYPPAKPIVQTPEAEP